MESIKNKELIRITKYKELRTRCDSFLILYTLILLFFYSFILLFFYSSFFYYTNSAGDPQDL